MFKGLAAKSARTIKYNQSQVFSFMEMAVRLKCSPDVPCGGMQLPPGGRVEDGVRFLAQA